MLEINKTATVSNAIKFFEKDLERYETMCAGRYSVNSLNFENVKVNSSTNTNAVANRYNLIITYADRLACVKPAIDNCTSRQEKPYKHILELKYLKHLSSWDVASRIGYGHTQFNKLRKQALLQFADIFLMEQLKQGVQDILDLHAYREI